MVTLKGEHIFLRALEPEDLEFVYAIENDTSIWELSNTQTPYSKFVIRQYLKNAHQDIYKAEQLRLVISDYKEQALGLIDIFDFDAKNKRAGLGILIANANDRSKGYGSAALQLVIHYCFKTLDLHQLYCNISAANAKSLKLFQKQGFEIVGIKKDWNYNNSIFTDEYLLQLVAS